MKIGIITMHSVVHHGSVLQAYATQTLLESLGHEVYIIDYAYPNNWQISHGMQVYKPSIVTKIGRQLGLKPHHRKWKKIRSFMRKYYKLTRRYSDLNALERNTPVFDVYVSGSDQIWNPHFTCSDPAYYFSFLPDGSNIMSFSSSFACESLDNSIAERIKTYLSRYKFISVRENNGANIIADLLGTKPAVTLDPTLMVRKTNWIKFLQPSCISGEYIFLYVLDYAFDPKPYIYDVTKYFSEKYNKQVISMKEIPVEFGIKNKVKADVGIEDFLSLIDNSFMVITSSFHGVAFSVNFGKPVVGVVKQTADDDRVSSLLRNLGLDKNIAKIGDDFNSISPFYDFEKEQDMLNSLRDETNIYLNSALSYFGNKHYE